MVGRLAFKTPNATVIPREQSDRGNLLVQSIDTFCSHKHFAGRLPRPCGPRNDMTFLFCV